MLQKTDSGKVDELQQKVYNNHSHKQPHTTFLKGTINLQLKFVWNCKYYLNNTNLCLLIEGKKTMHVSLQTSNEIADFHVVVE